MENTAGCTNLDIEEKKPEKESGKLTAKLKLYKSVGSLSKMASHHEKVFGSIQEENIALFKENISLKEKVQDLERYKEKYFMLIEKDIPEFRKKCSDLEMKIEEQGKEILVVKSKHKQLSINFSEISKILEEQGKEILVMKSKHKQFVHRFFRNHKDS